MSPIPATAAIAATLLAALVLGRILRRAVPEHHLTADAKDTVKFAIGMVATMTALLLGLLVSSAKSNYDDQRNHVITMAAKVVYLDRMLALYGPEAEPVRQALRGLLRDAVERIWPEHAGAVPELSPNEGAGNALLLMLENLSPRDEHQRGLKSQATALTIELGQMRTLLQAQSIPSVSPPLLAAVALWLVFIFATATVLAPPNPTTLIALAAAVCSVVVAIFLILELDQPFSGMLRLSSAPFQYALPQLGP
jgi:hypothetical protein